VAGLLSKPNRLLSPSHIRQALAIFDQCIVSGTSFATALFIGWEGARELGGFSLTVAVTVPLVSLQDGLVISPYTTFSPQLDEEVRKRYTGSILTQFLGISLASMLLISLVAFGAIIAEASADIWGPILALAIAAPCWLLRDLVRRISFVDLKIVGPVTMDATVALLQLGGLFLLGWFDRLTVVAAVLVVGLAQGCCGAIWLFASRHRWEWNMDAIREGWRRNWQFGRWSCASHVVGVGQAYSIHWILVFVAGTVVTGFFAACGTLVALSNPVLMGVGNLLSAQMSWDFSNGGVRALRNTARRTFVFVVGFSLIFAVVVSLFRRPLIVMLFGDAYAGSAHIVPLLAASLVASAVGIAADNALRAMNRPNSNFFATLLGLVTTLCVTMLMIAWSPLVAAACGVLCGALATAIYRCWAFKVCIDECDPVPTPY
jgi:O-antigen/teichoic acid export membrane protein